MHCVTVAFSNLKFNMYYIIIDEPNPCKIFKKKIPDLSNAIGQESNFQRITDRLLAEELITEEQLDDIKSKPKASNYERGSDIAHALRKKIKNAPSKEACLITICTVLEKQDDESLQKIGRDIRGQMTSKQPHHSNG